MKLFLAICALVVAALIAAMVLAPTPVKKRQAENDRINKFIQQAGLALLAYASSHDGKLPVGDLAQDFKVTPEPEAVKLDPSLKVEVAKEALGATVDKLKPGSQMFVISGDTVGKIFETNRYVVRAGDLTEP